MHRVRFLPRWIPGFGLLLLILTSGCRTTRVEDVSRETASAVVVSTRVLVVVEARPSAFRGEFEHALGSELGRRGVTAEASIGRLELETFAADPVGVARAWSARTGQSLLFVRPLEGQVQFEDKDRRGRYDTGAASLPTAVIRPRDKTVRDTMDAHEFAVASGAPSVVSGYAMLEESRVFEVAFWDASTGRSVWTARALCKVREGTDDSRWMAELAQAVVRRLRREGLVR
jgi:hypothetical protein